MNKLCQGGFDNSLLGAVCALVSFKEYSRRFIPPFSRYMHYISFAEIPVYLTVSNVSIGQLMFIVLLELLLLFTSFSGFMHNETVKGKL